MIEQTVGDFRRRVESVPGFCWVSLNPERNYGNGSLRFRFVLIGSTGAVQWMIGTEWMPAAARCDVDRRRQLHGMRWDKHDIERARKPSGYDLGYHARVPQYDGQTPMQNECEYLGGPCYYDGSSLAAEELVEGFLNGGDDWVWNRLEAYYRHRFEGAEYPSFLPIIVPHPDDRPSAS